MNSKKTTNKLEKSKEFQEFKSLLKDGKRILISTHALPDGDGLGAESAFFHYLKNSGKECKILNPDPLPSRYQFLDPKRKFLLSQKETKLWKTWDLWVIVDTNDPRRLGKLWDQLSPRSNRIVFLDHHPELIDHPEIKYPKHSILVSDSSASSIGELLYYSFTSLNLTPLTLDIALGLYVSVMTDTNSFRYSGTTPTAHQIAGKMIELGVNPEEVYQTIYSSKKVSHLQLLGTLLKNVKVSPCGRIAWIELPRKLRQQFNATSDETLSFLNLLLLIREAEVICFFREEDNGQTRVSIKSKGRIVINQVATELGGGGHEYAAGLALFKNLKETRALVIPKIERLLRSSET